MAKNIRGLLEVGEFNWLFSEYYCECQLLWSFEIWILLGTTLKHCYKWAFNKKLKLMGGAMKYVLEKLLDHEILRSMVFWATKNFFEKIVNPSDPPSYILNVRSLISCFIRSFQFWNFWKWYDENLVKGLTCYKYIEKPSCIYLILTNGPRKFPRTRYYWE